MNRRHMFAVSVGILSLALGVVAVNLIWFRPQAEPEGQIDVVPERLEIPEIGYAVSGPYVHENLSVFLIHAVDRMKGATPLTLEEALGRKKAVVHETGQVDELAIENVSGGDEVFVQASDIVKGGQQDRVLAVDLIVPARSGRVPLDAFCVEHGRWTQRGNEPRGEFSSSSEMLASKDLKVAAKVTKSQNEVWSKVSEAQSKLATATNANVASAQSSSSLQLSLESTPVRTTSDEYIKALSNVIDGRTAAIGFVFAIDGEINSGDVYGSNSLFVKLWPKLLKAAAVEAITESHNGEATNAQIKVGDVRSFLVEAGNVSTTESHAVTDRITMIKRDSGKIILLETLDQKQGGEWIHRTYILK